MALLTGVGHDAILASIVLRKMRGEEVRLLMTRPKREQVVGYVSTAIKHELSEIKDANHRLTESALVEEALMIALPQLRQRYGVFSKPVQMTPRRKSA